MKRTIAAFLLAPLAPPLLFWAFAPLLSGDHWPALADLPGTMLYLGVPAYLATAFVGVPAYLLIRMYAQLRAGHALSVSAIVGAAVLSLISEELYPQMIGLGALLGLSAGVTFWLIWRPNAA